MKDYFERRFLNIKTHHTIAAICAKCEIDEEELKKDSLWAISTELIISDCNKTIHLEIDVTSLKELENSLFKLRQIEEVSKSFREYIEDLRPIIEEKSKN
jgi:hypothetical protein